MPKQNQQEPQQLKSQPKSLGGHGTTRVDRKTGNLIKGGKPPTGGRLIDKKVAVDGLP